MRKPVLLRALATGLVRLGASTRLRVVRRAQRCAWALRSRAVPIDNLLMSGENGMTAAHYARVTGKLSRASTPMTRSPHVQFLEEYSREGRALLDADRLQQTAYYRNAAECIDLTGFYFDAKTRGDIRRVAERFLDRFDGHTDRSPTTVPGQSPRQSPVFVHPIHSSDCLQLLDGAHRVAMAHARGERNLRVTVLPRPAWTPMQDLLRDVLWLKGRLELYQPVDLPEVKRWTLVRRCQDRLAKMASFLRRHDLPPSLQTSYLDIAASYGWFVARMAALGYRATGIERDPIAMAVGEHAYGLAPGTVHRADCVGFLNACHEVFAVTSCFSLLHHFVLGRGSVTAEQLVRTIDAHTGRVLFVDTGQHHEEWFARSLPEWTPDHIGRWLKDNTTFREVHRLGPDADAVRPFERNYGRMLFACVR